MKELTRRSFLKCAGVTTLGVTAMAALTACGSKTTPETQATEATVSGAELEMGQQEGAIHAEEGTEFVEIESAAMGTIWMAPTLTPFRNTAMQRGLIIRYLYDRLAYLNSMGEYVPQGAKSWTVGEDGVTWTVELYDYITDSAGNPITVDDVIWFINTSNERATKPCFKKIQAMEKVDDYTMKIIMDKDLADAFQVILESTFMISQKSFEASADEMNTDVISASSYVVSDFKVDNSLTWTKRDDYWQKEELIDPSLASNVKQVTQILIAEASQQQIALETGTIDVMPGINASIVDAFQGNDDYFVTMTPANNNNSLMFSGDKSKLIANDLNLRKAICYAIDTQGLVDGAAKGYGEVAWDFIPRTSGGFQESWVGAEYYQYDPEKAKECLAASTYKGEELSLAGQSTSSNIFTIIQAYCQAVGINIKMDLKDTALWSAEMFDGRKWDMCMISTGNGGANMWTQFLDGDAYEYGDSLANQDPVLNDMIHFTWQNANYTPENINKVHEYLTENCIIYGLYLGYTLSVASAKLNIAETQFNNQGWLDICACKFAKV